MQDIKSSKAAGAIKWKWEQCLSNVMEDGGDSLAKLVSALCNLLISWRVFPNACEVVKLKPIFKMGKKTDPST